MMRPNQFIPTDVLKHVADAVDGDNVKLATLLTGRLEAMKYQWCWDDHFCSPQEHSP